MGRIDTGFRYLKSKEGTNFLSSPFISECFHVMTNMSVQSDSYKDLANEYTNNEDSVYNTDVLIYIPFELSIYTSQKLEAS